MKSIEYVKQTPVIKKIEIVSAVILLIGLLCVALYFLTAPKGSTVNVYLDGQLLYTYPLASEATVEIDGVATVVISGGSVRVENATCPDKLCQSCGEISAVRQQIVCLPNGLVVKIDGESDIAAVT